MNHPAWTLVVIGLVIAAIRAVWLLAPYIPWLGKLPGDIAVERPNFRFYSPSWRRFQAIRCFDRTCLGDPFHLNQREPEGPLIGFVQEQSWGQVREKPSDGTSQGLG